MNKKILVIAIIIVLLNNVQLSAQQTCPKWGPYVSTGNFGKQKGVLMMCDVMFPSDGLASYTYLSAVNFGIGKSGGYCGIQQAELNSPKKGNNIFSIWDFPNKKQIIASYKQKETYVSGFGNEGTGLHSHNDFGWLSDHWYTNIVRCWSDNDSTTQVGYWLYDQSANTWKHYVTFEVPEAHASLHGNIGSFLENFADDTKKSRLGNYKSYWMLTNENKWIHPDTLIATAGEGSWSAKKIGEDGAQLRSCGTVLGLSKYTFAVTMPATPVILHEPHINDMGAYYDKINHKLFVDWVISDNENPQLSYLVEVYDNEKGEGMPFVTASGLNPDVNSIIIPTDKIDLKKNSYYITLQIKDIFNQLSEKSTFVLHELK